MSIVTTPVRALALVGTIVFAVAWAGCAGTLDDPLAFTMEAGDSGAASDASADASPACPDVPTLFVTSCGAAGCHDPTTKAEALDLVSPGVASRLVGVAAVEGAGYLIDPSNPPDSVVYTKLLATPPFGVEMPTGDPLEAATIACVLDWVTDQASSATPGTDGGTTPGPDAGTSNDAGSVSPFTTVRIAAGQTSAVTDAENQTWSADESYTGGTAAVQSPAVSIAGTDSPALYNGQRYGDPSFSYQFTVPDGAYTVTLKFAELYVTGPGMRLFAIAINGDTVEPSFDIYATAGAMNTAVDRSYPVTVTGGQLQIAFTQGSVQYPKVDALQIVQGTPPDGGTDGGT